MGVTNIDFYRRNKRPSVQSSPKPNACHQKLLGMGWALLDALHNNARPVWRAKLRQQDSRLADEFWVELGADLQLRIRDTEGRVVAVSAPHRRRTVPSDQPCNKW